MGKRARGGERRQWRRRQKKVAAAPSIPSLLTILLSIILFWIIAMIYNIGQVFIDMPLLESDLLSKPTKVATNTETAMLSKIMQECNIPYLSYRSHKLAKLFSDNKLASLEAPLVQKYGNV